MVGRFRVEFVLCVVVCVSAQVWYKGFLMDFSGRKIESRSCTVPYCIVRPDHIDSWYDLWFYLSLLNAALNGFDTPIPCTYRITSQLTGTHTVSGEIESGY